MEKTHTHTHPEEMQESLLRGIHEYVSICTDTRRPSHTFSLLLWFRAVSLEIGIKHCIKGNVYYMYRGFLCLSCKWWLSCLIYTERIWNTVQQSFNSKRVTFATFHEDRFKDTICTLIKKICDRRTDGQIRINRVRKQILVDLSNKLIS